MGFSSRICGISGSGPPSKIWKARYCFPWVFPNVSNHYCFDFRNRIRLLKVESRIFFCLINHPGRGTRSFGEKLRLNVRKLSLGNGYFISLAAIRLHDVNTDSLRAFLGQGDMAKDKQFSVAGPSRDPFGCLFSIREKRFGEIRFHSGCDVDHNNVKGSAHIPKNADAGTIGRHARVVVSLA